MKRLLILLLLLLLPVQSWAAVAYGTFVNNTPSTNTSATSPSITTPTTNPVVVVSIAITSATVTISSVTTSGFGGTATSIVNIKENGGGGNGRIAIYCIVAPSSNTSGTVTANFSASVAYSMAVATFSGTDQTTPCPVGDAVFNNTLTTATSALLTPTNLTANDASVGGVVNDTAGNPLSYTPNNIYVNTGTAVNLAMGYATGTTGVTANMTGPVVWACVAIRIAAAAGGGGALNSHSLLLLGVGQ